MSLNISLQGLNISASNVAVDTIENIAQHFVVAVDDSKNSRHGIYPHIFHYNTIAYVFHFFCFMQLSIGQHF